MLIRAIILSAYGDDGVLYPKVLDLDCDVAGFDYAEEGESIYIVLRYERSQQAQQIAIHRVDTAGSPDYRKDLAVMICNYLNEILREAATGALMRGSDDPWVWWLRPVSGSMFDMEEIEEIYLRKLGPDLSQPQERLED